MSPHQHILRLIESSAVVTACTLVTQSQETNNLCLTIVHPACLTELVQRCVRTAGALHGELLRSRQSRFLAKSRGTVYFTLS